MAKELKVSCANGDNVEIDTSFEAGATVELLRGRVAAALELHPAQCLLLLQELELENEQRLDDMLLKEDAKEDVDICVVQEPCRIRSHQYKDYIDRRSPGFLPVDLILLSRFHPVKIPLDEKNPEVDTTTPDGFCHDPERVRAAVPVEEPRYVKFPEPSGLHINMMPFEIGKNESLPEAFQQYWPLIEECKIPRAEHGKIGYLTIHESTVAKGESQRRPGLHIESPGDLAQPGYYTEDRYNWGCGVVISDSSTVEGGIYMATNVPHSCRLWNVKIKDVAAAAGHLGDMEHMREALGAGECMEANRIYWLTDATPHESLPLEAETDRQFFRVVTSKLSAWYPEHSTSNELVQPDESITRIFPGSKFTGRAAISDDA